MTLKWIRLIIIVSFHLFICLVSCLLIFEWILRLVNWSIEWIRWWNSIFWKRISRSFRLILNWILLHRFWFFSLKRILIDHFINFMLPVFITWLIFRKPIFLDSTSFVIYVDQLDLSYSIIDYHQIVFYETGTKYCCILISESLDK